MVIAFVGPYPTSWSEVQENGIHDLICVYRARNVEEADVLVAWLDEHGIESLVKDREAALTMATSLIVAPAGIEVCVSEEAKAAEARALIEQRMEELRRAREADEQRPPIEAVCEECGQSGTFPYPQRGSVQSCKNCGAYMDVPDPEAAA